MNYHRLSLTHTSNIENMFCLSVLVKVCYIVSLQTIREQLTLEHFVRRCQYIFQLMYCSQLAYKGL